MTIFKNNEKVEVIASQTFRYDSYSGSQYFLERVDVDGKCGLVCVEDQENCSTHARVVLEPVYNEIKICKISTRKANFDRYAIFANGEKIGNFTMVLNEWIPVCKN
jgi:hypothetical protein